MKIKKLVNIGDASIYDIQENIIKKLKEKYNQEPSWPAIKEDDFTFDYPYNVHIRAKKYCVMFSGGCDSLSLVLRHLENGDNVALCHIIFNLHETYAAMKTYKVLKEIYGDKVIGMFKIFNSLYASNGEDTYGYTQQQITAFLATFIPRELKANCLAVESAYIMNDDAISYTKELKTIYNNALKFKALNHSIPYRFPLAKTKHYKNIEYIESIEHKYNVTFPTGSSENFGLSVCDMNIPDSGDRQRIAFIDCWTKSEKENKKNDVLGYIIYPDIFEDMVETGYVETVFNKPKEIDTYTIDYEVKKVG